MSLRYKGAVISATPPTTSSSGAAGSWTLQQQMQAQAGGNWPFGGPFNYIEDVFSTWLYTGNGSTQTITNGIDVTGKGALVWIKNRSDVKNNILVDTARGANNWIASNLTNAQASDATKVSSFSSTGFTVGSDSTVNLSTQLYASWTFRKQPKFFDVVTYTGNGVSGRQIAHNLGSTPGCIIIKCTSTATVWPVYHRSLGGTNYLRLNTTDASVANSTFWNNTDPTSTVFTVGNAQGTNQNTATYVAYLFAHDAGGFGLTGTDNVISCGSFTSSASPVTVTLGYEPQWLLIKRASGATGDWYIIDNMRSMSYTNTFALNPNSSAAETNFGAAYFVPTPTGFTVNSGWTSTADTWIYIAIRRGPMKTPTSGTSVFSPNAVADDSSAITTNFPVDGYWEAVRTGNSNNFVQQSRLTGGGQFLITSSTAAQDNTGFTTVFQNNTGYTPGTFGSSSLISYAYRRAPGFFDEVCYTGTGSARTVNHNLGVVPELMIVKRRDSTGFWAVYSAATGAANVLELQSSAASTSGTAWNSTSPTASVFTVGNTIATGVSGGTYVAYLFASCPGVSKVGSYTGTGATQTINCGFAARFVLIKRTDSTGSWFVWDTARGIVAGNDPYLLLNSTAAEVTNTDYVDTYAAGFEISSTAPAAINANGGTFIFLAIA